MSELSEIAIAYAFPISLRESVVLAFLLPHMSLDGLFYDISRAADIISDPSTLYYIYRGGPRVENLNFDLLSPFF
jgi:hypothetical protein